MRNWPGSSMFVALWCLVLVWAAVAWSYDFGSFLHPKALVMAVALVPMMLVHLYVMQWGLAGFRLLIPLWWGWLFWSISGLFTAQVLSYHIERLSYLGLLLCAASFAAAAFRITGRRLWLYRALIVSGAGVGVLALLQYAGLLPSLFPQFPGYAQPAYSVFGNQNLLGGYVALQLVLLTALLCRARRVPLLYLLLWGGVYGTLAGALIVSATRTAWLAAAVGGAWALLVYARRHGAWRTLRQWRRSGFVFLLFVPMITLLICAPFVMARVIGTFGEVDVGGRARLWFWAGALRMVVDNPLFGAGLGNFNFWSPWYQGLVLAMPGGEIFYHNELHTIHAHSEPLEWLAETGLLGTAFLGWFVISRMRRRNPAAPALITFAVFACFNTLSHSAPHVMAALLLAVVSTKPVRPQADVGIGFPRSFLMAGGVVLVAAFAWTTLAPSWLLCRAERSHIAGRAPEKLYQRAIAWPWPNPQAHESRGIALMDAGRFSEARTAFEHARQGIDTGRIYLLLAICAEAQGDFPDAIQYARQCLHRWPANAQAQALLQDCLVRLRAE